jgi:hypothetical protein
MKKLKIMEHVSLDGVIQASGEDDFPYAEWTAPYRTPAARLRARQHEGNAVRRHPHCLQGGRAFEDRIVGTLPAPQTSRVPLHTIARPREGCSVLNDADDVVALIRTQRQTKDKRNPR